MNKPLAFLALGWVDILIPAAIGGVLNEHTADAVKAGLIVEGANLPATEAGDRILNERGHTIVPDILANAGGVIASYMEWAQNRQGYGWKQDRQDREFRDIMHKAWRGVNEKAGAENLDRRSAAFTVAVERVMTASQLRGF